MISPKQIVFYKNLSLTITDHHIGSNSVVGNMSGQKNFLLLALFECVFFQYSMGFDTKIVNGSMAFPGEFPFMVSLLVIFKIKVI